MNPEGIETISVYIQMKKRKITEKIVKIKKWLKYTK
jgi:hypothetical protein